MSHHKYASGLHDFDMMKNEEIDDFRSKMHHRSGLLQKEREQWDWEKKACFLFPPQLESRLTHLPEPLHKRLVEEREQISFIVQYADGPTVNIIFSIFWSKFVQTTTILEKCLATLKRF